MPVVTNLMDRSSALVGKSVARTLDAFANVLYKDELLGILLGIFEEDMNNVLGLSEIALPPVY